MAATSIKRYIRPIGPARELLLERAGGPRHPFDPVTKPEEAVRILESLTSLDRDEWADAFMRVGDDYAPRADDAEARGDREAARQNYMLAYAYYRMGRYPAPNSPKKQEAYSRSLTM